MKSMKEMIAVGEKYSLFNGKEFKDVDCASFMESLPAGLGYIISIFLFQMTEQEQQCFDKAEMQFRIIKNDKGLLLTLMHIQGTDLYFELQFNPSYYKDKRALQVGELCNDVYIVGIESSDLRIMSNKSSKVPLKLAQEWMKSWSDKHAEENYNKYYDAWISKLERYSLPELWEMSSPIGYIQ